MNQKKEGKNRIKKLLEIIDVLPLVSINHELLHKRHRMVGLTSMFNCRKCKI